MTKFVLMLCLILSGASCFAHGAAQREQRNGLSNSMSIVINDYMNKANILEDLENVSISTAKSDSVLSQNILSTSINWKNPRLPLKSDTMFFVCNEQTFNLLQRFSYNYL